jgi:hypothetical protein
VQDDVFAVARAGIAPTSIYLSLIPHYQNENEYYVWSNIISNLATLEHLYPPFFILIFNFLIFIFYLGKFYLLSVLRYASTPMAKSFRNYVSKFLRPLAQVLIPLYNF